MLDSPKKLQRLLAKLFTGILNYFLFFVKTTWLLSPPCALSKKTLNYFLEIWIHKCCTKKLSTFYANVLKSKILDFGGSPVSQKDVPRKSFERNVVLERSLGGYDMRNFSHGLKFQPALRGEILLWLHGKFQPGFKHNFSIAAILFRWIFLQCACSNSRFKPGLNFTAITWGFSAFQPGLKILARFLKRG